MSLNPVVAAAIVDSLGKPTRVFAARRSYPTELEGLYELPGGKMDPGEPALEALHREIMEELGTSITIGDPLTPPDHTANVPALNTANAQARRRLRLSEDTRRNPTNAQGRLAPPTGFDDPGFAPWVVTGGRLMWVWLAEVAPGAPAPRENSSHSGSEWVSFPEVRGLPWIPADIPIVEELLRKTP